MKDQKRKAKDKTTKSKRNNLMAILGFHNRGGLVLCIGVLVVVVKMSENSASTYIWGSEFQT